MDSSAAAPSTSSRLLLDGPQGVLGTPRAKVPLGSTASRLLTRLRRQHPGTVVLLSYDPRVSHAAPDVRLLKSGCTAPTAEKAAERQVRRGVRSNLRPPSQPVSIQDTPPACAFLPERTAQELIKQERILEQQCDEPVSRHPGARPGPPYRRQSHPRAAGQQQQPQLEQQHHALESHEAGMACEGDILVRQEQQAQIGTADGIGGGGRGGGVDSGLEKRNQKPASATPPPAADTCEARATTGARAGVAAATSYSAWGADGPQDRAHPAANAFAAPSHRLEPTLGQPLSHRFDWYSSEASSQDPTDSAPNQATRNCEGYYGDLFSLDFPGGAAAVPTARPGSSFGFHDWLAPTQACATRFRNQVIAGPELMDPRSGVDTSYGSPFTQKAGCGGRRAADVPRHMPQSQSVLSQPPRLPTWPSNPCSPNALPRNTNLTPRRWFLELPAPNAANPPHHHPASHPLPVHQAHKRQFHRTRPRATAFDVGMKPEPEAAHPPTEHVPSSHGQAPVEPDLVFERETLGTLGRESTLFDTLGQESALDLDAPTLAGESLSPRNSAIKTMGGRMLTIASESATGPGRRPSTPMEVVARLSSPRVRRTSSPVEAIMARRPSTPSHGVCFLGDPGPHEPL